MTQPINFDLPPEDHLADTSPVRTVQDEPLPAWRRMVGLISLLGAFAMTIATAVLLITPPETTTTVIGDGGLSGAVVSPSNDVNSQQAIVPPTTSPGEPTSPPQPGVAALPTISPDVMMALLGSPLTAQVESGDPIAFLRNNYDPFTIIPDRPRSRVEQYEVQSGDTIFSIAERFGLKPETIAWSNDRSIIGNLRPGRMINILPVDGAYYVVPASETIRQVAGRFGVDPFVIIDSEFNELYGATPDTQLPSGTAVVIPGGEAEQITWNPVVERVTGNSPGAVSAISFSPGDPGSCGLVENPGGSGGWVNPLGGGYQWMRGFTSFHTGVDLSAPTGTPVRAAQGGAVIFAGWNSFGYGYAIVLAHGAFTTVYGHLSSINVGCRQIVSAGQVIGGVGSTGNSSGPHLHFEIRYNDVAQDPTGIMPF
jgi:murein DD-endopeptidase MepM/ murein hydrolase activator NlpD